MGVWDKIDFDFLGKRGIAVPDGLGTIIKNMSFTEAALYFKECFHISGSVDEIINEWNAMAFTEYSQNIKLKSGAYEYLSYLQLEGIKIGLATSNCRELSEAVLRNNGVLQYFDAISMTDEVGRGKEFPDIFLLAVEKLGLKPEECLVFEDILPAVLAAKSVGVKVIGVYDKYSEYEKKKIQEHADKYIFSFNELLNLK